MRDKGAEVGALQLPPHLLVSVRVKGVKVHPQRPREEHRILSGGRGRRKGGGKGREGQGEGRGSGKRTCLKNSGLPNLRIGTPPT